MNQLFAGLMVQSTAPACLTDLTAPTFAGIVSLAANADGGLVAGWAAGSDISLPISYDVYIQASTATGLFTSSNIALRVRGLTATIYTLASGVDLSNGTTYHVGVRAVDGVGNTDSNLVSLSAVSTGVKAGEVVYEVHAVFSISAANQLRGTFWATENGVRTLTTLGVANYTVYDADGVSVGITESSIAADANGLYKTTPVSATNIQDLTHYTVKIGIVVDGAEKIGYKAITLGE